MKSYLLIAFNTGMRPSEILGLHLSDFQDDGYINVERTRSKGIIGTGKSSNAVRCVPYPKFIYEHIKEYHADNSEYIFGNIDDAGKLRTHWKRIIENSGVEYKKLYATRHTFATLLLQDKVVSINELAGLLGHSSPKITLEHYASIIESKNVNLGENFNLFCYNMVTIDNVA